MEIKNIKHFYPTQTFLSTFLSYFFFGQIFILLIKEANIHRPVKFLASLWPESFFFSPRSHATTHFSGFFGVTTPVLVLSSSFCFLWLFFKYWTCVKARTKEGKTDLKMHFRSNIYVRPFRPKKKIYVRPKKKRSNIYQAHLWAIVNPNSMS